MKRLTLVRHAEALDPPATTDRERPLSEFGCDQARQLGQWFHQRQLPPHQEPVDLWLVSSALRARQTLEGIRVQVSTQDDQLHADDALYLAEPEQVLGCLDLVDTSVGHVCVVGHNPGLSMLAGQLTRARAPALGTACLVTLQLDLEEWPDLRRRTTTSFESWSP